MNATPLLDADARRAFTETLDENFCVSAGAGAGKTTAIVERIAQLAWQRRDEPGLLSRLAVVTYAKLSAEELRVRTRDRILDRLGQSAGGRQALLGQLRGAFFGTIHSFCLKLVSEEGHFLRLPSKLNLLEDRAAQALWERFCESDCLRELKLPAGPLARVSRHLTFSDLLDLAKAIAPAQIEPLLTAEVSEEPPELDFEEALAASGGKAKDVTSSNQRRLRSWQEQFRNGAAFLPLPEFNRGSGTFLEAFRGCVAAYARWLNAAAGALAARIAQAYRDYRLEQGWMSYDDQVFWCARLLERPDVLERLRARGFIVILDEAQDTDASMFSILSEITRPPGSLLGAWPNLPDAPGPLPGRFCFVGDEQQAIYSKRADLAVYRSYVDAYREGRGGRHLEFCVTMRCPTRVIDAVNGIFPDRLEQQNVDFRQLAPRPDCPPGAAWTWELRLPDAAPNGDDGVTREARRLAGFLRDHQPAGLGVARWAEIAVLAPRNDWLETAAAEFARAGLPVSLFSTKQLARAQPAQSWPAALLHVLLHPWDRFELIGVLREIFAVSDVDLARLHRQGTPGGGSSLVFWPAAPAARAGGVPSAGLARALNLLGELRAALPPASVSRYVDLVLERTALGARLEAIGETAEALETLRARALRAECEGVALRDWVDGLVQSLDDPAPVAAGSADAIQLVTCHKAKGLEWPVVLALGMGAQLNERSSNFPLVEPHPGGPRVHLSQATMDTARKEMQSQQSRDEYQRLLYVTLTRAKHLLIVPDGRALHKKGSPNFLELARWHTLDLPALFSSPPGPGEATPVYGGLPVSQPAGVFVENGALIARAAGISQSAPRRMLPSGEVHHTVAPDDPAPLPVSAEGGTGYGDWWHSVLQHYPWAADPEKRTRSLAAAAAALADDCPWRDRGKAELARLASSAAHAEFLAQGAVFLPEMPFAHPRDADVWIEGIMDLVIVTKSGSLWIIDWKTDRRPESDPDEESFLRRLGEKYAPQLAPYAEVCSQGLGRPVARLLIYSTVAGALIDVPAGKVFVSTSSVPFGRRT